MLMRTKQKLFYHICLLVALSWFSGCTGLTRYATVTPLQLTPAEEVQVGAAVEGKLLQMLGGPYYDKALANALNSHVKSPQPFKVAVADRSAPALYPLPGGRVIITRGLLAEVNTLATLKSLLSHAIQLSNNVYKDRSTRSIVKTTEEVLSASTSIYNPDSAAIRLARLFEQEPCVQDCLETTQAIGVSAAKTGSKGLPESIVRLSSLHPGYELVATARQAEKTDDQAKAVALYLQAAATSPDEPLILGALGLAYLRAGQLQPARLHLQKAVELQPDYYRTQMGLGYLYLQQGKLQQANQALARSVQLLPVTENLFLLAEVREKSGDAEEAMSLYRIVAESDRSGKLGRTSASRLQQAAGVK